MRPPTLALLFLFVLACECELSPGPRCPPGFVLAETESECVSQDMFARADLGPDGGPCGDCGDRVCDTESGMCVDCLSEADCGGDTPLQAV